MKIISKKIDKNIDDYIPFIISETRYIIVDDNDATIDDAQGYGYKSYEKATKAMWYKYKNGKDKIENEKSEALNFWKNNKEIEKFVSNFIECNYKDNLTDKEIIKITEKEFNIELNIKYLKYLKDIF